jgi:hypothetical protein
MDDSTALDLCSLCIALLEIPALEILAARIDLIHGQTLCLIEDERLGESAL